MTPGQLPVIPIASTDEFPTRTFAVIKKGPGATEEIGAPMLDALMRNNDRMNRPGDRQGAPNSQSDTTVGRAKATVTYPE